MSQKYKTANKEYRAKLKAKLKAAKRAKYAAMRDSGENSKRTRIAAKRKTKPLNPHRPAKTKAPTARTGNSTTVSLKAFLRDR